MSPTTMNEYGNFQSSTKISRKKITYKKETVLLGGREGNPFIFHPLYNLRGLTWGIGKQTWGNQLICTIYSSFIQKQD